MTPNNAQEAKRHNGLALVMLFIYYKTGINLLAERENFWSSRMSKTAKLALDLLNHAHGPFKGVTPSWWSNSQPVQPIEGCSRVIALEWFKTLIQTASFNLNHFSQFVECEFATIHLNETDMALLKIFHGVYTPQIISFEVAIVRTCKCKGTKVSCLRDGPGTTEMLHASMFDPIAVVSEFGISDPLIFQTLREKFIFSDV